MKTGTVPIPPGLRVSRNSAAEQELIQAARVWLESESRDPSDIHVSDLLAQRLAYWRRVKPLPLSDRLVTVYLVGKILHAFVISAVDQSPLVLETQDAGSLRDEELGVVFSPDMIHRGIIRELKTTRSFYAPKYQDDIQNYLDQLVCYMAAKQHTEAQLWVLFLNLRDEQRKTRPEFRAFSVTAPLGELQAVREWMAESRKNIESALWFWESGVRTGLDTEPGFEPHRSLPLCPQFMCGKNNCQWFGDCKPEGRV